MSRTSCVTVLYHPDEITRYSLTPLVLSRQARAFRYVRNVEEALAPGPSRKLLIFRFPQIVGDHHQWRGVLKRLRDRFDRLVYFDDRASADSVIPDALELADLYYKKQIARDREIYLRPLRGVRRFRSWYEDRYGIREHAPTRPAALPEHLHKLRLAWNLGVGIYPRGKIRLRAARLLERSLGPRAMRVALARPRRLPSQRRDPFVSARFSRGFGSEALACQRRLYQEAIGDDPRFRTGRLSREAYNRELRAARVTLSPFGYGEVCFRDFEAVWSGSTLVKPAMEYVETWPDVYRDGETCETVSWDGSDVVEKCVALLEDPERARGLAENAFDAVHDAYAGIEERVEQLLGDLGV